MFLSQAALIVLSKPMSICLTALTVSQSLYSQFSTDNRVFYSSSKPLYLCPIAPDAPLRYGIPCSYSRWHHSRCESLCFYARPHSQRRDQFMHNFLRKSVCSHRYGNPCLYSWWHSHSPWKPIFLCPTALSFPWKLSYLFPIAPCFSLKAPIFVPDSISMTGLKNLDNVVIETPCLFLTAHSGKVSILKSRN